MTSQSQISWFLLLVVFTTLGCEPSSINSLTPEVRFMADTIFARKKNIIEKQMDSICIAQNCREFSLRLIESRVLNLRFVSVSKHAAHRWAAGPAGAAAGRGRRRPPARSAPAASSGARATGSAPRPRASRPRSS